jgi:serralysin
MSFMVARTMRHLRGVSVNLTSEYGIDTYNYADTLKSIENVIGTRFTDHITGNASANRLEGGLGNDTLKGLSGNDTLIGGAGNDRLSGGKGADVLTGGSGYDIFIFDTAASSSNIDKITDFSVVSDTIWLENSIFTKLVGTGTLTSAQFHKSTSGLAHDKDDRIIYETDTGKLFYDSNGNAGGGAVQIALLSKNLSLTAADFFIT